MHTKTLAFVRTLLLGALLVGAGCEDYDDNDYNHTPPAGQGSLIVDNETPRDYVLYVDGSRSVDVRDGNWEAVDLIPGVHRVVLVDDDNDNAYANDVDILEGRRTILRLTGDSFGGNSLQVNVFVD